MGNQPSVQCCTTPSGNAASVVDKTAVTDIAGEKADGVFFTDFEPVDAGPPGSPGAAEASEVASDIGSVLSPKNRRASLTKSGICPPCSTIMTKTQNLYSELSSRNKDVSGKYDIFSWLQWTPEVDSPCGLSLHAAFPGAVPGPALHHRIRNVLGSDVYAFKPETTLLGTSLCPDEINNEDGNLIHCMKSHWGHVMPLGGISGAPFAGATGFSAFSHHVPDNGDIILVYGPHVGISDEGEIGKYRRTGQSCLSTSCGAIIGAYHACCNDDDDEDQEFDDHDMQMHWIKTQLEPHVDLIRFARKPMAALAYQAYEMINTKLDKIVNNDFGSGRLVLMGGIQINMPPPFYHHFLPLRFEMSQKGRKPLDMFQTLFAPLAEKNLTEFFYKEASLMYKVFGWLQWSPGLSTACLQAMHKEFPGALPGPALHYRIKNVLGSEKYGFKPDKVLLGTSLCPDEINNEVGDIVDCMKGFWGHHCFPLGGISGVPFVGSTGFKAFSHHVPDSGDIILVFGPHVGISSDGEIGKCHREGQRELSTSCGAVVGAYGACLCKAPKEEEFCPVVKDGAKEWCNEFEENDMQMGFIKKALAPHVEEIKAANSPLALLAYKAYEMVKCKLDTIVNNDFGSGRLVLMGGIQINMPAPCPAHFLPLRFKIYQKGKQNLDLISTLGTSYKEKALQKGMTKTLTDDPVMGA